MSQAVIPSAPSANFNSPERSAVSACLLGPLNRDLLRGRQRSARKSLDEAIIQAGAPRHTQSTWAPHLMEGTTHDPHTCL
jgi:hypothetical protein